MMYDEHNIEHRRIASTIVECLYQMMDAEVAELIAKGVTGEIAERMQKRNIPFWQTWSVVGEVFKERMLGL